MTSPVWGLFIGRSCGGKPHHIIVERSKDDRVCPFNFIGEDVDPLTKEEISSEKLQSPQMIYLPNYVTDAKAFMLAILRAGKKEFSDPNCRRKFSTEEHEAIVSQILDIFQISEEELDQCFEIGETVIHRLDLTWLDCYIRDSRAFNENGQYTERAQHYLLKVFHGLKDPTLPQIDDFVDRLIEELVKDGNYSYPIVEIDLPLEILPVEVDLTPFFLLKLIGQVLNPERRTHLEMKANQIKNHIKRFYRSRILLVTGFYKELRKDDRATSRIEYFEKMTGVSLREVSQEV
ncbi:MAG: hypothetical protein KDK96_07585, partial [Chlamydiia bacterium]|nr:hypothetical protein [Chlamydiia bacterium]